MCTSWSPISERGVGDGEAPAIIIAIEPKGQHGGLGKPSPMCEPCHYPVSNRLAAPTPLSPSSWEVGGDCSPILYFFKLRVSLTFLILPILMSIHFFRGQVLRDQFCVSKYSTYFILFKTQNPETVFCGLPALCVIAGEGRGEGKGEEEAIGAQRSRLYLTTKMQSMGAGQEK